MEVSEAILLSDSEELNEASKTEIKDIISQFNDFNQKKDKQLNNIEMRQKKLNHSFNKILKKLDIMQNNIKDFQQQNDKRPKTPQQIISNGKITNTDFQFNKSISQKKASNKPDSKTENENLIHERNLKILFNLVIHHSFDKISKIVSNLDNLKHKKKFSDFEEKQIILKLRQIKGQENIKEILKTIFAELLKKIKKEEKKINTFQKDKKLLYKAEKEAIGQELSEKGYDFVLKKHFYFCAQKNKIYCYNNPRLSGRIKKYATFKCIEKNCEAKLICVMGKYRPIFQGRHTDHGGINRNWLKRKYEELDNKKWTHAQIAKMNGQQFVLYKY